MLVSAMVPSAITKRHLGPRGISCRINFALLSAHCTWKYDLCEGIDMLIHTRNSSAYEQIQLNCFIIAGKKLSALRCPPCPPTAECQSCLDTQSDCMSTVSEGLWRDGCVCACVWARTHVSSCLFLLLWTRSALFCKKCVQVICQMVFISQPFVNLIKFKMCNLLEVLFVVYSGILLLKHGLTFQNSFCYTWEDGLNKVGL